MAWTPRRRPPYLDHRRDRCRRRWRNARFAGHQRLVAPAVPFPEPPPIACPADGPVDLVTAHSAPTGFVPPESVLEWAENTDVIDLPSALQLANVRNPEIALAANAQ